MVLEDLANGSRLFFRASHFSLDNPGRYTGHLVVDGDHFTYYDYSTKMLLKFNIPTKKLARFIQRQVEKGFTPQLS